MFVELHLHQSHNTNVSLSLASFLWSRGLMDFTRAWYLMSSDFMPIMCGSMLLVPE